MSNRQLQEKPDAEVVIEQINDLMRIRIEIASQDLTFSDEFDMIVLEDVSVSDNISPAEIVLKGLFLEFRELGYRISYENEKIIKNTISDYCDIIFA
jgi:hypothetical protein